MTIALRQTLFSATPLEADPPSVGTCSGRSAGPLAQRRARGATAHHAGFCAEQVVARHYAERGCPVVAQRWRGPGGEIDLVVRDGAQVIFIEVKHSATHDQAAAALGSRQIARIRAAATEYLEHEPRGQMTDVRLDLAMVDGMGRVAILENICCD